MGRNLEGLKKGKKRSREEVSDTESDESPQSLKNVFISPSQIKREIKRIKRETKTPQREVEVETPIQKERKSAKKEVRTVINIKKEAISSNTESSDDSSKSGAVKISKQTKTIDNGDSGSESEGLANSFRIQMLKEETNRIFSKTKNKRESLSPRKSDKQKKKHKKQSESEEDTHQISIRKGDRSKKLEKNSDFESEFNSSSTSRNSILKDNIHSTKPKYIKESALSSRKSDKRNKKQSKEDSHQIFVRKGDKSKKLEKSSDFESEFNSSSTSRNSILKDNIHSPIKPKYIEESAGSESDSGISHINVPKVQMKEVKKQPGIVFSRSKSSDERKKDLSEDSSDFSLEEQRQEDERVVKKIGDKIQQHNKINILQNINIGTNPMEQLKSLYPNLRRANLNVDINIANSDIYLLKIPKTIDPNILLNIEINPSQLNKFKAGKKKYVLENIDNSADTKLLILGDHSEIVNIQSNIFLKKYLKPVKISEIEVPYKVNVPLPNNLKERHPLFGANFEEKIELRQEVREKLDLALANKISEERKRDKSKKKKKQRKSEGKDEVIFDLLRSNSSSSKRKKKIKHEIDDDTAFKF